MYALVATLLAVSAGAPAAGSRPLTAYLGLTSTDVLHDQPNCQTASAEPLRVACDAKGLGAAHKSVFLFDAGQKVISISLTYPPADSAAAAEQAVMPLLHLVEASRGPPQVKKVDGGREWVFSRRHFVALVRLTERAGRWETQTLMSDPTYKPWILPRPGGS